MLPPCRPPCCSGAGSSAARPASSPAPLPLFLPDFIAISLAPSGPSGYGRSSSARTSVAATVFLRLRGGRPATSIDVAGLFTIIYSAATLRRTLAEVLQQHDPQGVDPALNRMVIVG